VQSAARAKGVQLPILKASTESEIDSAFATLVQLRAGALVIATDPFLNSRRDQLVALASQHAVPAMYYWREFAAAGGLISYGPSNTAAYRQAGICVGKILKGAKPADLPVDQISKKQRRCSTNWLEPVVSMAGANDRLLVNPTIRWRGQEWLLRVGLARSTLGL